MYLRECFVQNVGPIASLDLSFELGPSGNPKPVIFVGKNGTGKTFLLAYIVDALTELAKQKFGDIVHDQRLGHMPFFKVTSFGDSRSLSGSHLCLLEFEDADQRMCYIEKVGVIDPQSLSENLRGRFETVSNWPKDERFHKHVVGVKERVKIAFESGAICFFPASRHERPHWLNAAAVEEQTVFGNYFRPEGQLHKPLVVERTAENNQQWLMDVLLDSMMDFSVVPVTPTTIGQSDQVTIIPNGHNLQNKLILKIGRQNVEQLLRQVLEDDHAELAINFRNAAFNRIGIKLSNDIIVPSLMHLSAGQSLLFNLFATIIRYADRGDINKSIHLEQIEGIVLIDEIDAHLHSDLQFKVLPRLINLFPKVQFVVSSHAPLFLLGMEEQFGADGVQIVEMPMGLKIGTERFEEFRRSFKVYRQTKAFEEEVESQLRQATKPLVLTEGQTDPVFIRTALELLGHKDLLSSIDIDQVGSSCQGGARGGGDSHLNKAWTFLNHNHQRFKRRVLLLYDNDTVKPTALSGPIVQRAIPKNANNNLVPSGIENLLPVELFNDRDKFYVKHIKQMPDGGNTTTMRLNKEKFCQWVCKERKEPADFAAFETHLVPILREFICEATTARS